MLKRVRKKKTEKTIIVEKRTVELINEHFFFYFFFCTLLIKKQKKKIHYEGFILLSNYTRQVFSSTSKFIQRIVSVPNNIIIITAKRSSFILRYTGSHTTGKNKQKKSQKRLYGRHETRAKVNKTFGLRISRYIHFLNITRDELIFNCR